MLGICIAYAKYMQIQWIGCPRSSDTENWHQATPIHRLDITYLRLLTEYGVQKVRRECIYDVAPVTAGRQSCGKIYSIHVPCIC